MSTKTDAKKKALQNIGKNAGRVRAIESVAQVNGSFTVDLDRAKDGLTVSISELPSSAVIAGENVLVSVGYKFRADPSDGEAAKSDEPAVLVEASYLLTYRFEKADELGREDLFLFAEINGRFNANAYWREYLTACLARAGLPPFFVPPFNAAARIEKFRRELEREPDEDESN